MCRFVFALFMAISLAGAVEESSPPAGAAAPAAEAIKQEALPATVKEAMDRTARGAVLSRFEKTIGTKGKAVYTARYTNRKGRVVTIAVSEDGKLVRNAGESERKKH